MTTTPFYGPNTIVISESEFVNKNGLVQGEGDRVIIGNIIICLFHVYEYLEDFFLLVK